MRPFRTIAFAGGMLLALGATSWAQANYPNRLVKLVVPFAAGSVTDGLARILADKLADIWNQQVIVENRPGLAGTTSVAKSQPDGYTLMVTSNGHTVAGVINKNLQFDPINDFAGVTKICSVPMVAVVPPDLPAKTLADFIALAKEKPGKLNFSTAGVASTTFLSTEIFKQAARIDIVHVPYKSSPEAVTAVIRGDSQLHFAPIPLTQEMVATKKVRALAVNSNERNAQIPDIPTVKETIPAFEFESWFAVMAPAGTPRAIVNKASADIAKALKMPDVIEKLWAQGAVPSPTTPEALDAQVKRETEINGKLLREAGVGAN
jgi:tripartite-type tricarboxylate transporter receptor subunit TctC